MRIDCAFDNTLAKEIASYLKSAGHAVTIQDSIITTRDDAVDDLAAFATKTKRQDYQIKFFEDMVIFSREIPVERMGLNMCKQCGFLAKTKADLDLHQDVHLPKNWVLYHR